jgi:hypothetical protein
MVDWAKHTRRAVTVVGEPITVAGVACVGDFRQAQNDAFGIVDNVKPSIQIDDSISVAVGDVVVHGAVNYTVAELDRSTPGLIKAYLK